MAAQERSMPFIKNLASSDRKIRTSALTSLHTFLSARQIAATLTPLDSLKLWKGLFYALWMCDRAIPQQTLCAELADLIYVLPREAVVSWLRGFWATMSREWTGIDVLRMEKFLLLVRRVVGAGFRWMKVSKNGGSGNVQQGKKAKANKSDDNGDGWDAGKVDDILNLLEEWPFAIEEEVSRPETEGAASNQDSAVLSGTTIPVGLKLHVLDIWVDEAEKVGLLEDGDGEARKILQRISALVDALEKGTTSPAVRIRSKESLADERLPGNKTGETANEDAEMADTGDGGSWDGFED
ncbi:nucleolar protein,Nop52-domain-containing protein [Diplogelasinospora grovesii]|uniref:Nucleolar protein,Nop52-domain-containing protein n=1 Tax=Diplogelasinospora grovesii TaxID=303347 RepID=A0AAN6NCI6_9PEZI|nr:nucleolar protein,Nop52-domain-containing protein [Diplogelasinospora grovesii]